MKGVYPMSPSDPNGETDNPPPERMTGTVVRVFLNRGYGFIRGEDGLSRFFEAREVFPAIAFDRMHEGQAVDFIPATGGQKGNGLRAIHIEPRDEPEPPRMVS